MSSAAAATPVFVPTSQGYPPLYRPRNPRATPLFRLVEAHYENVKALWEDRFEKTHRRWRGFTDTAVARYLDCASPECGFARLRCDTCHSDRLLLFSCRQRSICPSCDAKRAAAFAAFLNDDVFEDVPHSMWVRSRGSTPAWPSRSCLQDSRGIPRAGSVGAVRRMRSRGLC